MVTVGQATTKVFKQVRLERNSFMMAAHYFDVHIGGEGIQSYFMWKRNDSRFPIYHHIMDMMKRSARNGKSIEDATAEDERSIYIPYDSIQGVVTYKKHKEIQLLSTAEQVYFIFRNVDDYDEFVSNLKENIGDRYFTRDDIDIEETVYMSK